MKKRLIRLLILVLIFSSLSYFEFHDEEHVHHIHALSPGDPYGTCPSCHTRIAVYEAITNLPTCTNAGMGTIMCECGMEGNVVTIPALGHSYRQIASSAATCTDAGSVTYSCERCGSGYTENIAPLGHNYKSRVTKEATCEEDGIRTYTCSRCSDSYTRKIEALGHDIQYEEKEATCTEDGFRRGTCTRCDKVIEEIYPALGHDLTITVTKAPTCTEEGEREAVCSRCEAKFKEKILPAGHKFPKEWTLEKEPSYTEEGLETKTCYYCGYVLTHVLPRKDMTSILIGAGAAAVLALGGLWLYLKKLKASKILKKALEETKKFEKPSFEDKSILVSSKDEDLLAILKNKSSLEVSSCEDEDLETSVEENGPDLVIIDVLSEERLEKLTEQKEGPFAEQAIAAVTVPEFLEKHKDELDQLVRDRKIISYLPYGSDKNQIMMKFILPILKPDLKSDESLSNIGAVADFLGIPAVSTVIDYYTTGRDIRSTLQDNEELGISEISTIIGDIASILGLDTVSSVSGLVGDIESIKEGLEEDSGAHEEKGAYEGVKDIVDVVSDLMDKD